MTASTKTQAQVSKKPTINIDALIEEIDTPRGARNRPHARNRNSVKNQEAKRKEAKLAKAAAEDVVSPEEAELASIEQLVQETEAQLEQPIQPQEEPTMNQTETNNAYSYDDGVLPLYFAQSVNSNRFCCQAKSGIRQDIDKLGHKLGLVKHIDDAGWSAWDNFALSHKADDKARHFMLEAFVHHLINSTHGMMTFTASKGGFHVEVNGHDDIKATFFAGLTESGEMKLSAHSASPRVIKSLVNGGFDKNLNIKDPVLFARNMGAFMSALYVNMFVKAMSNKKAVA